MCFHKYSYFTTLKKKIRKDIEYWNNQAIVCNKLILLQNAVCLSLLSWKLRKEIHFSGKNAIFQGGR